MRHRVETRHSLREFGWITKLTDPGSIAVDNVNNEIYVTNGTANSINVYARTANGSVAPTRIISGATTSIGGPYCIAVDTVNNEIFVGNYNNNTITVYNRTDSGNVAPKRIISGAATGLDGPWGIAVDAVNNEIYAGNANDRINNHGLFPAGERQRNADPDPVRRRHRLEQA